MVTVSYYCPRCDAIAELERDAYLDDKCVTAEPLEGWEYANAYEDSEARSASGNESGEGERGATDGRASDRRTGSVATRESSDPRAFEDADGITIVCGAAETDGEGCGEPYYLSFVKFDEGEEVEPDVPSDEVSFDFLR
ncbi:MAG: hypothetical protein ACI8UR_000032 [Natronomonas sp.]|jgi:hypothetical protein|uniref:hypothetical protein n=1 Tax=Natronomonas sp. TaxID=2184060 RepID=UPI0039896BDA